MGAEEPRHSFRLRSPSRLRVCEILVQEIPSTVAIALEPAATIRGRVVDRATGKPAAGVPVSAQATNRSDHYYWNCVSTDSDGDYRLTCVPSCKLNIWPKAKDRTAVAIDSFAIRAGQTRQAPDLELIKGGFLEGRVIDAETGKPIARTAKGRVGVATYGPAHPESGAAVQGTNVDENGRFRMRVPPGTYGPYIGSEDIRLSGWLPVGFETQWVEVKEGQTRRVEFHVLPPGNDSRPPGPGLRPLRDYVLPPGSDTSPSTVRYLYRMVATERSSNSPAGGVVRPTPTALATGHAQETKLPPNARITRNRDGNVLGLDLSGALTVERAKVPRSLLEQVAGISTLERLNLSFSDVSDDALEPLKKLRSLRELNLSFSYVTGKAIRTVSTLQNLLSLQLVACKVTDDDLKALADMPQLVNLCLGETQVTDAGLPRIAVLSELVWLDLRNCSITDQCLRKLGHFKQLQNLWLSKTIRYGEDDRSALTDASVEYLSTLKTLVNLQIADSQLTDEGLTRLRDALPKAAHRHYENWCDLPASEADGKDSRQVGWPVIFPRLGSQSSRKSGLQKGSGVVLLTRLCKNGSLRRCHDDCGFPAAGLRTMPSIARWRGSGSSGRQRTTRPSRRCCARRRSDCRCVCWGGACCRTLAFGPVAAC